ncbi:MAG: hypothetical protein FJ044_05295 [Candidatus Cloacimonetes bacterium]|nr:hypothetical protein [Candidatus Cloacimonadota bacterium]
MMETINISLPYPLSSQVNTIVRTEGYASRSEFFRTLLRLYLHLTTKTAVNEAIDFLPFKKKPLEKIEKDLLATGNYSESFIASVVKGLSKSSFYQNEN